MQEELLSIINNFGINTQLKKLNEECYELIEAVREYESVQTKNSLADNYYKKHLIEEFADIMVLLKQIKLYYRIKTEEINKTGKQKIKRTLERIKEGYYK